ncbi:MAG TPA: VPDSG-CTERM sorting domain-containing protein [Opitutaceae bacterium]|jgi:hypothetical protein
MNSLSKYLLAGAALAAFASVGRSDPTLMLFDVINGNIVDEQTVVDNGSGDQNPNAGVVEFNGSIQGWDVNTTVGLVGTNPTLDISSVDRATDPQGDLYVVFSDNNIATTGSVSSSIGGTTSAPQEAINFWTYSGVNIEDLSNLLTSNTLTGSPFSASANGSTSLNGSSPYSLTEVIEITDAGSGSLTSFDANLTVTGSSSVPDSGTTLLLLALGLAVIGLSARRFRLAGIA